MKSLYKSSFPPTSELKPLISIAIKQNRAEQRKANHNHQNQSHQSRFPSHPLSKCSSPTSSPFSPSP